MISVDTLLNQPFSSRSSEEKDEIKTLGRLMPNLNIVQTATRSKDRSYNRHFKQEIHDRYSWICGCEVRIVLFFFIACCLEALIHGPGAE
jgi:hypothetical protein